MKLRMLEKVYWLPRMKKIVEAKQLYKDIKIILMGNVSQPEIIARNLYRKMFEMDALKEARAYLLIPEIKNENMAQRYYE